MFSPNGRASAVRHTTDEVWAIVKGQLCKGKGGTGIGGAAVPPILRDLERFAPRHCGLELWVDSVLDADGSPRNHEVWRWRAMQNHLQYVTVKIASLPAVQSEVGIALALGPPKVSGR
jgi:hypothetical protein